MFKIYQIHERGGAYEDCFDHIVGSYLHKEKADRELKKFNDALNERYVYYQKCSNCSAQFGCSVSEIDTIRKRCNRFAPEDYEPFIWFCKNAVDAYDESVRYEVEEVDVDDDEEVKE